MSELVPKLATETTDRYGGEPIRWRTRRWIDSVRGRGRALGRAVADLLVPPTCVACRAPLSDHGRLCPTCWARVDFIRPPCCDRLGIPLPFDTGGVMISAAATANPPDYDRARAVAAYDGVARDLIHALKYHDRLDVLPVLVDWTAGIATTIVQPNDLVIPVPLSRYRLLSRRHNQAALLAKGLAARLRLSYAPMLLRRTKRTRTQVGLTASERRRNVQGAFAVSRSAALAIAGRGVVLVDDVITSGATVEACARTLRQAGASRVDVLAVARVVAPVRPTV